MCTESASFIHLFPYLCKVLFVSDIVALPDYTFAAMENYGLIMFKEMELIVDEKISPYFLMKRTNEVLSHEFAHQVFSGVLYHLGTFFIVFFLFLLVVRKFGNYEMVG